MADETDPNGTPRRPAPDRGAQLRGFMAKNGPQIRDFVAKNGPAAREFVARNAPAARDFVAKNGPAAADFVAEHGPKAAKDVPAFVRGVSTAATIAGGAARVRAVADRQVARSVRIRRQLDRVRLVIGAPAAALDPADVARWTLRADGIQQRVAFADGQVRATRRRKLELLEAETDALVAEIDAVIARGTSGV